LKKEFWYRTATWLHPKFRDGLRFFLQHIIMKKLIIGLLLAGCVYYAGGFVLLATGCIDKLPVFVNKVLMNKSDADTSGPEEDGPYVFHHKNGISVCYIEKNDSGHSKTCRPHTINDSLLVGPAKKPLFRFTLKSRLNLDPVEYALPGKMCVISDVEGNFDAFVSILKANRVIDTSYNWTFDSGHLVLLGDFVDRGLKVTEPYG
jgi:hypothetical protein